MMNRLFLVLFLILLFEMAVGLDVVQADTRAIDCSTALARILSQGSSARSFKRSTFLQDGLTSLGARNDARTDAVKIKAAIDAASNDQQKIEILLRYWDPKAKDDFVAFRVAGLRDISRRRLTAELKAETSRLPSEAIQGLALTGNTVDLAKVKSLQGKYDIGTEHALLWARTLIENRMKETSYQYSRVLWNDSPLLRRVDQLVGEVRRMESSLAIKAGKKEIRKLLNENIRYLNGHDVNELGRHLLNGDGRFFDVFVEVMANASQFEKVNLDSILVNKAFRWMTKDKGIIRGGSMSEQRNLIRAKKFFIRFIGETDILTNSSKADVLLANDFPEILLELVAADLHQMKDTSNGKKLLEAFNKWREQ